jgi:glycosyltransferase involved in cell wall biosynthesis
LLTPPKISLQPFGLALIEAMAYGTPVIAWRCGSVSEIVDEGKTGFIVDTEDEAVRAVLKLDQIDRRTVRRVFQERFTAEVMARCACSGGCAQPLAQLMDAIILVQKCRVHPASISRRSSFL